MTDKIVSQSDVRQGEELLLSLIYPIKVEDMTVDQAAEFSIAAHEQAEYASDTSRDVERETVGDVSVSYRERDIRAVNMHGARISPVAVARLQKCGLLCLWI